jgi:CHAD domain-containing protein
MSERIGSTARREIGDERNDALHATRIAAKRLRYTLEFFASVLSPARDTALGLLTLLQDQLGAIADEEAFIRFYSELSERISPDDSRMPGLRALLSASKRRRAEAIARVRALWNGGEFPPYPDMLAASLTGALAPLSSPGPKVSGGKATSVSEVVNARSNKSDL